MMRELHAIATPPDHFSEDEWRLRVELAACYRVFDLLGWTELIYNHITLRVPGAEPTFLINPFGLAYREVRASNLVRVDLEGRIIGASDRAFNPAGFMLHAAFHESTARAHCVMHTHTTAGMAVACSEAGLTQTNFYSAQLEGEVAYHDFEGISLRADERPRLARDLGRRHVLFLRNHGLLTVGENIAEAFAYLWTVQRACEVQIAGASLGPAIRISPEIAAKCREEAFQFDGGKSAAMAFDALARAALERDPSFTR